MLKKIALTMLACAALGATGGIATAGEGGRIVGGSIAANARWPQQVSVQDKETNGTWSHGCGGTVLSPTRVLTAAHCFYDSAGNYIGDPAKTSVLVGTNITTSGTRIQVTVIDAHTGYNHTTKNNDIAILTLAAATTQPPAVLTTTATDAVWSTDGAPVVAIGWGNLAPSSVGAVFNPQDLYQVDVALVNFAACNSAYGGSLTSNMICAGNTAFTKDTCQGDSGGPLFVWDGQGRAVQTGIVSFGRGCAQSPYPGVYTRIAAYQAWITARVPDAIFATTVQSGWYTAAGDAGRGYAIEIQGSRLYMAALMYDTAGNPAWYSSLGTMAQPRLYTGRLQRFSTASGSPVATDMGEVILTFTSDSTAQIEIGDVVYAISRLPLNKGQVSSTPANFPETGWYYDVNQAGKGQFVDVQADSGYSVAFTYDTAGNPTWLALYANEGVGGVNPASIIGGNMSVCTGGPVLGGASRPATCRSEDTTTTVTYLLPYTATLLTLNAEQTAALRRASYSRLRF